jgi:uncharacterized membrane protein YfcA
MIAEHALIAVAALLAAGVTFFSGFGLGTALLPAFAAFMPTEVAVGMVAIVHLLNNAFKFGLLRGHVNRGVFIRFGIPALIAAPVGALVLGAISDTPVLTSYSAAGTTFEVTITNLVIAVLLVVLGTQELVPAFGRMSFPPRFLVAGGAASGFLGGLAGLQGALRSAFLIRAGLSREAFIATGVAVAVVVDAGRLATYGAQGTLSLQADALSLALTGVIAASVGSVIGNRLLRSVTIRSIQIVVGILLVVVAVALGVGLI